MDYRYTASCAGATTDGRVRLFALEERDKLLHEAGLAHVVAHGTASDTGYACWIFDPPIDLKPGMALAIRE
jgi:hypothetical protein